MRGKLRYALRTLVGPWLVLPAVVMEIAAFFQRGMPWRGEGMWTVDWFGISLFILGPLAAGAAAVDAARLSRPGNVHLVVSVPRPARAYLRAAAWCAGPLVVLHLLTITAAFVIGEVTKPSISWLLILSSALIQCAAIVWYVALGSAVGRFANPLLAGIAAGVGAFLLYFPLAGAFNSEPRFGLLALGGATITMVGKTYDPGYLAGQAVMFAATSVLFLLLPLRIRSGYRVPEIKGIIGIALTIAMIVTAPRVLPPWRTPDDDPKPPTLCTESSPVVCIYWEHRRYADLFVPQLQELIRAAQANGYSALVPEKVIEASRSYEPSGPGVMLLWLPAEVYEEGRFPLEELAYFLISPSHCAAMREPSPNVDYSAFDFRLYSVLATWLHLVGTQLERSPVEPELLDPAEVEQIMRDFDRCNLDGRA